MTWNQQLRQNSVRATTGTAYNYEDDWHALFDQDGIAEGFFNDRLKAWINVQLSSSYQFLSDAMRAYAISQGFTSWAEMGTFIIAPPPPLDVFTAVTPDAAVGVFAWSSASIGVDGVRTNDGSGTTNYAYGSDGWLASGFTGQRIDALFAQSGTTSFDQSTLANRPTIRDDVRTGRPYIDWSNKRGSASSYKIMPVTNAPTTRSGRNWCVAWVQRGSPETQSGGVNPSGLEFNEARLKWSMTSASGFMGVQSAGNATTGVYTSYLQIYQGTGGGVVAGNIHIPNLDYSVHVINSTASGWSYWIDGQKQSLGGLATSNLVTIDRLGQLNTQSLYNSGVAMLGIAFFPSMTDGQVTDLTSALWDFIGRSAQTTLVYFDGNSITAGFDETVSYDKRDLSWPYLWMSGLPAAQRKAMTGVNMGWSGAVLNAAGGTHVLMTNRAGKVNAHASVSTWPGFTKRVCVLLGCSNDLASSVTAASIITDLQTYHDDAIAAGFNRCYIGTEIPRKNLTAPQEVERLALNALILSTFTYTVDFAADDWQTSNWNTYFQGSNIGVHPNAAGRALMAARFQSTISSYLP